MGYLVRYKVWLATLFLTASVSTIFAGFISTFLQKYIDYIFLNCKHPSCNILTVFPTCSE